MLKLWRILSKSSILKLRNLSHYFEPHWAEKQNIFWCNKEFTLSVEEVRYDGEVNEEPHSITSSFNVGEDLNANNNENNANIT